MYLFHLSTGKAVLPESQIPELGEKVWTKEDLTLMEKDQFREYLNKKDMNNYMGPDGIHPQLLMQLANVIVRPFLTIFASSWRLRGTPEDWKKENVTTASQKGKKEEIENYMTVSLILIPRNLK